ncbi:MAG TPA: anhydro-N-acetylmuramic acid kinase [Cyclobacteriaceae bacterium]|nr:anhydro-N-acetylmuramic acid kinase [Cyclobacteriaceae bacterium]
MDSKQKYKVIGLMSGTSLDGVDIACCTFSYKKRWTFTIEKAETVHYSSEWFKKLKDAHTLSAEQLHELDHAYGKFLGGLSNNFIRKNKIRNVDFISSHGHTIFHQPEKGFTLQIGNGNDIHTVTGLPVIFDFRSLDVANGGQGAPLVPIGDKLLFSDYDVCLNFGGIANLSFELKKKRVAYDVCYVNMGLNYLAEKIGKKYDAFGDVASSGELNKELLSKLQAVYQTTKKKRPALAREFFEQKIQPLLDQEKISVPDRLRTFTESIAQQLSEVILKSGKRMTVLCTGGGALNSFLMYRLVEHCGDDATLVIPEKGIIDFKEAIVFAFLGVLRSRNEINCLKSVTGATQDSSAGLMIGSFKS